MIGIALAGSFLSGILLRDAGASWSVVGLLLVAALLVLISLPSYRQQSALIAMLILAAAGAMRAEPGVAAGSAVLDSTTPKAVRLRAEVDGISARTPEHVRARLHRLEDPSRRFDAWLPGYPVVAQGDVVQVTFIPGDSRSAAGGVQLSDPVEDGALFATSLTIQGNHAGWPSRLRQRLNDAIARRVHAAIPEPAGSLALGVLNGDDSGMTSTDRARFRAAGFSHITAVSGWNVSVVAGFVALIVKRGTLHRHAGFASIILATWTYAFLVGMSPSVTRAAALATIFVAARWRGRARDLVTGLMWATAAILAVTPALRFDVGFQLSVAATMGLALTAPHIEGRPGWQQALLVPVAAQIAVAPLLLHHFGAYSLLAPLNNLLVAPLIVPTAAGGFVVVLGSLIHPRLADALGIVAWVPGRLIMLVAETAARLDWASGVTVTPSWPATLAIYLIGALSYLALSHRWSPGRDAGRAGSSLSPV